MKIAHSHYKEIVQDIRDFIEKQRENGTIVHGYFKEISPVNNHAKIELEKKIYLNKGSLILIENLLGRLIDVYGNKIIVEFKKDASRFLEKKVEIDTSRNNIILNRLEKTITKIEEEELDADSQKFLDFLVHKGNPTYKNIDFPSSSNLNESQREVVEKSLAARDFHLVMGPPGTGKTHVITNLINDSFKEDKKILITAHTNVGVDNILERIEGIDEDLILRVGPAQSIAPSVARYSIGKRREKHPLWKEVVEYENTIKMCYEDIGSRWDELRGIKSSIEQMQVERDEIKSKLEEFLEKREKFDLLAKESKPLPIKKLVDLKVKEKEISNKEITAAEYYYLALDILAFKILEKDLPKGEDYYQLEEDIQEMHANKSKKRISGIIRRKSYQEYLDDLKKMEKSYNEMTESYNRYWRIRDPVEVRYKKLYSDREGKPDEDAVKCELDMLDVHQEYLELKKNELTNQIEYNKDKLIYECYIHFLESVDYSKKTEEEKIKSLNTQIHLLVTEKDRLIGEIRNIKNTISKRQEEQLELILSIEREILDNSQIIATTVISSAQYLLDEEKFDLMLMDEASQVATYMSLMTLLKCKKFILVGDHKQLQPIPEEKLKSDLNLSIFNRLISLYPENYTFLDTQYRMNQEIAELSSELFYEGKLKTHPPIVDQTLNLNIESQLKRIN
jgi:superfamily I DNA and/or RNA helicase